MRAWTPLTIATLGLTPAPALAADSAQATADAVRAADTAFSARAQSAGTAEAFREFMDPVEALEFSGGPPIRGADAIYQAMGGNTPSKRRLAWVVKNAWGAKSGDLGVTTGTWRSTALDGSGTPATGHYVTVWRKDVSGQWKGLIDIGDTDPK
jgi:ketosteroid isomerase-like protein